MSHLYSFDIAVARILADHTQNSFAFVPLMQPGGTAIGGTIFTLGLDDEDPENPYVTLLTETGLFWSSEGEEDVHGLDQLAEDSDYFKHRYGQDPRALLFKACTQQQAISASGSMTEYALAVLNGEDENAPRSLSQVPEIWLTWLTQHLPG